MQCPQFADRRRRTWRSFLDDRRELRVIKPDDPVSFAWKGGSLLSTSHCLQRSKETLLAHKAMVRSVKTTRLSISSISCSLWFSVSGEVPILSHWLFGFLLQLALSISWRHSPFRTPLDVRLPSRMAPRCALTPSNSAMISASNSSKHLSPLSFYGVGVSSPPSSTTPPSPSSKLCPLLFLPPIPLPPQFSWTRVTSRIYTVQKEIGIMNENE